MTAVLSIPALGRPFWLLFGGEAASAFGTSASVIALPVVAMQASGDVRQAGLASTALSAGILLARLPAGVFADRFDAGRCCSAATCSAQRSWGFWRYFSRAAPLTCLC